MEGGAHESDLAESHGRGHGYFEPVRDMTLGVGSLIQVVRIKKIIRYNHAHSPKCIQNSLRSVLASSDGKPFQVFGLQP